jgi:hypothetical protein
MIGRIVMFVVGIYVLKFFLVFIDAPQKYVSTNVFADAQAISPQVYLPELPDILGQTDAATLDNGNAVVTKDRYTMLESDRYTPVTRELYEPVAEKYYSAADAYTQVSDRYYSVPDKYTTTSDRYYVAQDSYHVDQATRYSYVPDYQ